jgi:hypothetical protein
LTRARQERIQLALQRLEREVTRSCGTCAHYSPPFCEQLQEDVPDWFKPFGCDDYKEEGVPF